MLNNQIIPIIMYVYALIMFYVIESNPARWFSPLSFHIERYTGREPANDRLAGKNHQCSSQCTEYVAIAPAILSPRRLEPANSFA